MSIWQFSEKQRRRLYDDDTSALGGSHGAPIIVPAGDSPTAIKSVNVVQDFEWTVTVNRSDVPYISLKEYYIDSNPLLNQIANNLAIVSEAAADLNIDDLVNAIQSDTVKDQASASSGGGSTSGGGIGSLLKSFITESQINPGSTGENNPLGDVVKEVTKTAGVVIDHTTKIASQATSLGSAKSGDPLNPYKLLYSLTPTQFEYILPYFDNSQRSITNSFSDSPSQQPFGANDVGQFINKPLDGIAGLTSVRNIMEPGMYIEKPQYYSSYNENKQQYNINFPLSNTGTYEDVKMNWEFIYLLVYQNTQNRVSRTLVAPPVIYEAEIPGVWYSPYATIQNLKVDFLGARRTMNIQMPGAQRPTPVIIPDTYNISLTITDLHSQSQNFLHNIIHKNNIISAS